MWAIAVQPSENAAMQIAYKNARTLAHWSRSGENIYIYIQTTNK